MATGKITKTSVESIEPPSMGKRAHLWDDILKGFGVMVTDRGARSYLVQYRIGGRGAPTRRVTIGKHGSPWTAETARTRAKELLHQVDCKVDPFDAVKAQVEKQRLDKERAHAAAHVNERLGFSVFADRFVEQYAKVKQPKSWREIEAIVRRDLKPVFGDRPLTQITDADIVELLDQLRARGATPSLKAYKVLRLLFGFASDKERRHLRPAASPMLGIKPPAAAGKRERILSDVELRYAWLGAGGLGWPFGPIVRLLILTGQRRDEVAGMAWPEIDKVRKQWVLPGVRSKNGLPNLVPLSPPALSIVDDVPVLPGKAGLLFTTTGETPVSGFSRVKARLDASMLDLMRRDAVDAGADADTIDALRVEPWVIHDLRRTAATGLQRLKFPTEVIEAVLNHQSGSKAGIVGRYQLYKFEKEKRAALEKWGRHVTSLLATSTPSNVVMIGSAS
ncbi:site-specific integrase [Sphingomonas sp.]|uniref:tyrosine-type recombinase/integrase n=1 Tax=Sphingomonas sp. TaxID=28214 RepID=UPI002600CB41|nr:site-specific integrase [Sphingomonas sp.]